MSSDTLTGIRVLIYNALAHKAQACDVSLGLVFAETDDVDHTG
jgi:hypothetical protein